MSSIQPITEATLPCNGQKDKINDENTSESSCLQEDTRKMGKTARCLTLFHNLTIMIALLLALFQYYEAASISLVASMVALFRVQQEEDENFEDEDLSVAEVQQTTRLTSPRSTRRKKRKGKKQHNCKDELTNPSTLSSPKDTTPGVSSPAAAVKDPVLPNGVLEAQTSRPETKIPVRETMPCKSIAKIEETLASNQLEDASANSGAAETVERFLEDNITEAFDDEVAKFRARLETIQSSAERPKIKISGGVFAKQLAAKKSAARRSRSNNRTGTSFSI